MFLPQNLLFIVVNCAVNDFKLLLQTQLCHMYVYIYIYIYNNMPS